MTVGIDLGTTHSSIAIWENNKPFLIPDAQGRVLRYSDALLQQCHDFAAVKREVGKNKVFRLGQEQQAFRPEELYAFMIKSLLSDGENYLRKEIKHAVITVPAHFNDVQRKSVRHAGELAGLQSARLLNDTTATSLVFSAKKPLFSGKILIVDLGGGTFDASVIELVSGHVSVSACAGDSTLGGNDFVDILESYIFDEISKQYSIELLSTELRGQVQQMVHQLTDNHEAFFFAEHEGKNIKIAITASQFEELARPLVARIIGVLEKLESKGIDRIVFTGGASRMPMIAKALFAHFGLKPEFHLSPASMGAAIAALENQAPLISEVCPYFLTIRLGEKRDEKQPRWIPLFERNTVLPTSRTDRFYTYNDYQTTFHLQICQGSIVVGEVLVIVPPRPAGQECIEVRCSYDSSGLLEVGVLALKTGKYKKFISNHQIHYF